MPAPPNARLVFYAVDGLGLGHVTRLLAIARAVRARQPDAQILFLTTSEADQVIFQEGFAAIKLPSKTVAAATRLRPQTYAKLVQTVAWNAIAAFNPALLVVDTFPAGAMQELLPILRWEMRRAFVYRAQQADKARDPFFQNSLALYDLAIIPHPLNSEEMPLPDGLASVWTGDILLRTREESLPRGDARARLGLPQDGRILYVTFGGGGAEEVEQAQRVTFAALGGTDWTLAVADAPLDRSRTLPLPPNARRVAYYPMAECFAAFDGAISAAGYNSVTEILHHGLPAVLIPFARGLDNQFARVRRVIDAGAALTCALEPEALRAAVKQLSDPKTADGLRRAGQSLVPASGAGAAAGALWGLIDQ